LKGTFYALLACRKLYLIKEKRDGIKKKVKEEIKSKNPLKPMITQKSVKLAKKATVDEFRRAEKMSQKAHCEILYRPSNLKENRRQSIRRLSQETEVLECSFKPKINSEVNDKIGFTKATMSGVGIITDQGEDRLTTHKD